MTPIERDFEIATEAGLKLPDVLGLPMDQYLAWEWFADRNPMRGYHGVQHLIAHRIAMEASTLEHGVSIADVMWWQDLEGAVREAKKRNPHELDSDTLAALEARGITW